MSYWKVTSTGVEVDLLHPSVSDADMEWIPHHLATINRFTGAAVRPYSVAEHSLLVCQIAEREFNLNVHGLIAALLHEAHKAITGDLHTPGRQAVGNAWRWFEERFERMVRARFRVVTPTLIFAQQVKAANLIALATERAQLLPIQDKAGLPLRAWPELHGVQPADWVDLMDDTRTRMTWQDWRQAFADRYAELNFDRGLRATQHTEGAHQ